MSTTYSGPDDRADGWPGESFGTESFGTEQTNGADSAPRPGFAEGGSRRAERLTADQVDAWDLPRAPMTRRGFEEEAVLRFKRRVQAELATAGQVESELRARIADLAAQLRASYGESAPAERQNEEQYSVFQPEQRVTAAAVNAIATAQRQAEEQIRSAEEYVRSVTEYARNQYQVTVNEGHRQGLLAAETAFAKRSDQLSENLAHLESQLDFLKAFGVAFGVQIEGALEKAREEVHTMIGTIKTAFDTIKHPAAQPGGQPRPTPIG